MTIPVPSNGSLIYTFADCPDRGKEYLFEPPCLYGSDNGWVTDDEGNVTKMAYPATCLWRTQCGQCPRGFQR